MKLERFVTVVFDLQHKFVGRNPLSKVFFTQRFRSLIYSRLQVRVLLLEQQFFLLLQQSCRDQDSNPQTFLFVSSLDYQSGMLTLVVQWLAFQISNPKNRRTKKFVGSNPGHGKTTIIIKKTVVLTTNPSHEDGSRLNS